MLSHLADHRLAVSVRHPISRLDLLIGIDDGVELLLSLFGSKTRVELIAIRSSNTKLAQRPTRS